MRKLKGHDLGRAAGIVRAFHDSEDSIHEDISTWNAPSECHALIRNGEARRFRTVRRQVKAVTGLPWRVYVREIEKRTTARCVHFLRMALEPSSHGRP